MDTIGCFKMPRSLLTKTRAIITPGHLRIICCAFRFANYLCFRAPRTLPRTQSISLVFPLLGHQTRKRTRPTSLRLLRNKNNRTICSPVGCNPRDSPPQHPPLSPNTQPQESRNPSVARTRLHVRVAVESSHLVKGHGTTDDHPLPPVLVR